MIFGYRSRKSAGQASEKCSCNGERRWENREKEVRSTEDGVTEGVRLHLVDGWKRVGELIAGGRKGGMQGLCRLGDLVSHGGWVLEGYAPRSPCEKCEWKAVGLVGGDRKLIPNGQHNEGSLPKCCAVPEPGHH